MLFGLLEVALPSISEAKRAWTLIQLLIRPRGRRRTPPVVEPLKPQLGHTFAGSLEAWSHRVTATARERVSGHLLQQVTLTLEDAETLTSWSRSDVDQVVPRGRPELA